MRIAISTVIAGLCLASSVAVAQPAADEASLRADLSDLRTRLFTLVDRFDHAHAGRDTIEGIMGITFPGGTDPSMKDNRPMADDLFLKGYRHLDFNQYFDPAPRMPFPGARTVLVKPSYIGAFETVPFDQDETTCLSLHEFRDHLTAQGWVSGDSKISIRHNPDGSPAATTRLDFTRNHVDLFLTVRGIPSGVPVPPAYAAKVVGASGNDCLTRVELSDGGT